MKKIALIILLGLILIASVLFAWLNLYPYYALRHIIDNAKVDDAVNFVRTHKDLTDYNVELDSFFTYHAMDAHNAFMNCAQSDQDIYENCKNSSFGFFEAFYSVAEMDTYSFDDGEVIIVTQYSPFSYIVRFTLNDNNEWLSVQGLPRKILPVNDVHFLKPIEISEKGLDKIENSVIEINTVDNYVEIKNLFFDNYVLGSRYQINDFGLLDYEEIFAIEG